MDPKGATGWGTVAPKAGAEDPPPKGGAGEAHAKAGAEGPPPKAMGAAANNAWELPPAAGPEEGRQGGDRHLLMLVFYKQ